MSPTTPCASIANRLLLVPRNCFKASSLQFFFCQSEYVVPQLSLLFESPVPPELAEQSGTCSLPSQPRAFSTGGFAVRVLTGGGIAFADLASARGMTVA